MSTYACTIRLLTTAYVFMVSKTCSMGVSIKCTGVSHFFPPSLPSRSREQQLVRSWLGTYVLSCGCKWCQGQGESHMTCTWSSWCWDLYSDMMSLMIYVHPIHQCFSICYHNIIEADPLLHIQIQFLPKHLAWKKLATVQQQMFSSLILANTIPVSAAITVIYKSFCKSFLLWKLMVMHTFGMHD